MTDLKKIINTEFLNFDLLTIFDKKRYTIITPYINGDCSSLFLRFFQMQEKNAKELYFSLRYIHENYFCKRKRPEA